VKPDLFIVQHGMAIASCSTDTMANCSLFLIVDDDQDLRESIAEFLALEGYTVHVASNGSEALEWIKGCQSFPN
jgi:PleD family two-component response regulator